MQPDEIARAVAWAEDYKDSTEIGPHGFHDSTFGDLARVLLALKAERDIEQTNRRKFEVAYNILFDQEAALKAERDAALADARRWRAVRDMWFGANLAHPEADGCVLVEIQLPKGCKVSAYPEATIDEAADRLAEEGTDA